MFFPSRFYGARGRIDGFLAGRAHACLSMCSQSMCAGGLGMAVVVDVWLLFVFLYNELSTPSCTFYTHNLCNLIIRIGVVVCGGVCALLVIMSC